VPSGTRAAGTARASPTAEEFARIDLPDAEVGYWRGLFSPDETRSLFDALRAETRWERHRVRSRGREVDCPRLSGWKGDATYSYSGITLHPASGRPGGFSSARSGVAPPSPTILEPGSLLVMRGPTQRHWLDSAPPTRRPVGPCINLTSRRILA